MLEINRERFDEVTRKQGAARYLELFYEQPDLAVDSLQSAVDNAHAVQWYQAAHRLKGAAATLGFTALAAELNAAQQLDQAPNDEKQACLARIKTEIETIRSAFSQEDVGV